MLRILRSVFLGAFNFCSNCGHGGHTLHILKWFEWNDVCATGCGCHCPTEGVIKENMKES
jgi:hypothetical protein